MKTARHAVVLPIMLGMAFVSVTATASRVDPLGSSGGYLPLFMPLAQFYAEGMIDSGCSLVLCQGSCDQWDTGWECWTEAVYERYGYDEEGRHDLPISISAVGDCTVVHVWTSTVYCSDSNDGSGRADTDTSCWINTPFSGNGWNDGYCTCTEL